MKVANPGTLRTAFHAQLRSTLRWGGWRAASTCALTWIFVVSAGLAPAAPALAPNAAPVVLSTTGSASLSSGSGSSISFSVSTLTDFTITFWIKTTDAGGSGSQWYNGKGLVDGEYGGATTDFGVALIAGKIAFGVGSPDTTILSAQTINDGTWHHVAAMRSGATMKIYIDGVVDTTTSSGPAGARSAVSRMAIGLLQTGVNGSVTALMSEVRIYNSASAAFVADAFAGPVSSPPAELVNYYPLSTDALDYSGKSKTGTATGVTWSALGPFTPVPASFALTEDTPGNLTFVGNIFSDADSATLTATLSVSDGTITGNAGSGITVGGTATARTFEGAVAALNTYFATAGKITYQGAANNTASRTLTIAVSDGSLSSSATSTINFTAVNDAPVAAASTL
ncbi:MAG: LamG domain-containing protein, partial [Verrucomicrobiota bacterium]